jgi:hypothetical protein
MIPNPPYIEGEMSNVDWLLRQFLVDAIAEIESELPELAAEIKAANCGDIDGNTKPDPAVNEALRLKVVAAVADDRLRDMRVITDDPVYAIDIAEDHGGVLYRLMAEPHITPAVYAAAVEFVEGVELSIHAVVDAMLATLEASKGGGAAKAK